MTLLSTIVSLALAAGMLTAGVPADEPVLIRTPYNGQIYAVDASSHRAIGWQEWNELGHPAFTDIASSYVKVLSMPTVYALTALPDGSTISDPLTPAEYRNAGSPRVAAAPWAEGIIVYKWSTSSELFFQDVNRNVHKLTPAQWAAAGHPAFEVRRDRGFVRMSWDGSGAIAYMCEIGSGRGGRISYAQWKALGAPTPKTLTRTATDFVVAWYPPKLEYFGPTIFPWVDGGYYGPQWPIRELSYREWTAMGAPAPTPKPHGVDLHDLWCEGYMPTPWE